MEALLKNNINIEESLRALSEKEKERIHAALFTLILILKKSRRDAFFERSIDAVISKFPGRIFTVTVDEKGSPYLNVRVESVPLPPALFCEKIHIDVASSFENRVPSLVLPHLLSDLPVYLIWPGIPDISLPFLPFINRLIIESETAYDSKEAPQKLLKFIESKACEMSDLTWSALKGWRAIFSNLFNEKEELEALSELKEMVITYHDKPSEICSSTHIRALYFSAWVASHMEWECERLERQDGNFIYHYKGDHRIILHPERSDLPLPGGALLSFEMESKKGRWICVRRSHEKQQAFIQRSSKTSCELPTFAPLSSLKEGEEIIEELFRPMQMEPYRKTLEHLRKLNESFKDK